MQYIRTKQAEENWNLHLYNFLAGRRKTVPLACRSEDWIKTPTPSCRWLPPVVKATVRIFSSRTDLPQSLPFHTAYWVPKTVFSATSSVLNGNDMLWLHGLATLLSCFVNGGFEISINNCWKNIHNKFCSLWYRMSEYILTGRLKFIGRYEKRKLHTVSPWIVNSWCKNFGADVIVLPT